MSDATLPSAVTATPARSPSRARGESLGVRVIRAAGRFTGPAEVEAGTVTVRARRFVIATGSSPTIIRKVASWGIIKAQ